MVPTHFTITASGRYVVVLDRFRNCDVKSRSCENIKEQDNGRYLIFTKWRSSILLRDRLMRTERRS